MNTRSWLVRIGQMVAVAGLAFGTFGASCSDAGYSSSGGSGSGRYDDRGYGSGHSGGGYGNSYDSGYGGGGVPYDDRDRRRSEAAHSNVPRGTLKVVDDKGVITYTAPFDGRIWVTEGKDNEVIFSRLMYRGETFRLDPKKNRGYIDGREVLKREILGELYHRIFFDRDRGTR